MAKSHLKLVTPTAKKRTVAPRRRRNGDLRTREYLTEAEVERLMDAASGNRYGHRDATMILVAYRHGLRVSELVDLRTPRRLCRSEGAAACLTGKARRQNGIEGRSRGFPRLCRRSFRLPFSPARSIGRSSLRRRDSQSNPTGERIQFAPIAWPAP